MAKVTRKKPVDEIAMPVEEDLSDQLVDLAHGFTDEITLSEPSEELPAGHDSETSAWTCPRCRSQAVFVQSSRGWEDDLKVRYLRCRSCRFSFKDVQTSNGKG